MGGDPTTENPLIQTFYWADAANGMTLDQLKARRAVAAAMASRSRPYPTTIGQGLSALGEGIGQGIYERNLARAEAAQHKRDVDEVRRSRGSSAPAEPVPPAGASSSIVAPDMVAEVAPVDRAELARTTLARQGTAPGGPAALPVSNPNQPPAGSDLLLNTRFAALNTGTMSDAGQPGATYGGPSPAGPGASTAEPPAPSPSTPSVPPSAVAAAAQPPGPGGTPAPGVAGGGPPPVPRAALAGPVLAQAGVTPPGSGRAPPRAAPLPPTGQVIAPAATGITPAPQPMPGASYPAPGEIRETPPTAPGKIGPPPQRMDTPEMIRNRAVRNDPRNFGRVGAGALEQMDREYNAMKERRDKEHEQKTEQWQKLRDDNLVKQRKYEEDVQSFPKRQQEAVEREMKNTRIRRFGNETIANEIDKSTKESAEKNAPLVQTLRSIPELKGMVDQMFTGSGAESKLAILKFMNSVDRTVLGPFFGNKGYFTNEIEATEAFKSAISSQVATALKSTVGSQGISNADREFAQKAAAGDISLEPASIKRVLEITRRMSINSIKGHNERMDKVYDDPQRTDTAIHRMFKVPLPDEAFDPEDIMHLKATQNSPEERARFDSIYGAGAARRITGFGR